MTMRAMAVAMLVLLSTATVSIAQAPAAATGRCGDVISVATHDRTTTRYALVQPPDAPAHGPRVALLLLPGGGGHLDLDDRGCPRALTGNILVRALPQFHGAGLVTALLDAPSDHPGEDGLAGFRVAPRHAADIGAAIADLRRRTGGAVWLAGASRGAISAVNAAARLSGPDAPDGVLLASAVMSGGRAKKAWVEQTVFDLPLEAIGQPVLVIGHAADHCIRSPAGRMGEIVARLGGGRRQAVAVTGGPGGGAPGIDACQGNLPHNFIGQEAEVVAGMARFIRGGGY